MPWLSEDISNLLEQQLQIPYDVWSHPGQESLMDESQNLSFKESKSALVW